MFFFKFVFQNDWSINFRAVGVDNSDCIHNTSRDSWTAAASSTFHHRM